MVLGDHCKTDLDCADFGKKYYCCHIQNICRRNLIIYDFNWKIGLGLFFNLLFNILTNSIGVSGSGLVYSLLVFFFEFKIKEAIPIYKMCNLIASFMTVGFILSQRKDSNQNDLYIDWNIASFCICLLFSGSMIGILFNEFFPGIYIYCFIYPILLLIGYINVQKIRKKKITKEHLKDQLIPKI